VRGVNANTGKELSGVEHLHQSVRDILSTPIGSRVLRREYGSQLPRLVDAPLNRSTVMDIYAATADAITRWEPRLRVTKVSAEIPAPGKIVVSVTGVYLPEGRVITLEGIEVR
jgi:phage baseplate assembly protein W